MPTVSLALLLPLRPLQLPAHNVLQAISSIQLLASYAPFTILNVNSAQIQHALFVCYHLLLMALYVSVTTCKDYI